MEGSATCVEGWNSSDPMDKKVASISIDPLEDHDDGVYPWAQDTLRDWATFVQEYGNEFANLALEQAQVQWPPERLIMDISTKCNLRCPMCNTNGDAQAREKFTKIQYDWRELADFVINSGGAKLLSLGSLGETFLKDDTLLFMEAVKDCVEEFAFNTNATAIDVAYIQELAKFNVSSIRISCDAGDPVSYPIWRKGADFKTFHRNSREFARLFGDKVALHTVFFRENLDTLKTIPEFTADLNIQGIELHSIRRVGTAIRSNLHSADLDETCDLFNTVGHKAERLGITIHPMIMFPDARTARLAWEKTNGRIGHENYEKSFINPKCGELFGTLNVAHHGELSPCCGGPAGQVFSDPFKRKGQDLLNSRAIVMLRALTLAGKTPTVCKFYCKKCYTPTPPPE